MYICISWNSMQRIDKFVAQPKERADTLYKNKSTVWNKPFSLFVIEKIKFINRLSRAFLQGHYQGVRRWFSQAKWSERQVFFYFWPISILNGKTAPQSSKIGISRMKYSATINCKYPKNVVHFRRDTENPNRVERLKWNTLYMAGDGWNNLIELRPQQPEKNLSNTSLS